MLRIRLSGVDAHWLRVSAFNLARLLLGVERAVARAAGAVLGRRVKQHGWWENLAESVPCHAGGMRGPSVGRVVALPIALALMIGVFIAFPSQALAQQPSPAPVDPEVAELGQRVDELANRFSAFANSIDSSLSVLEVTLTAMGIIIVVVGGLSTVGFIRAESRAKESHALAIQGERAAQDRAGAVHGPSRETLELVNETLRRTEEAAKSTERTSEIEAGRRLALLDEQARALIDSVPDDEVYALVSNPTLHAKLIGVAQKIDSFEASHFILSKALEPTPCILFIRGMDAHLRQDCEESIELWKKVVGQKGVSGRLQTFAWYWIGREQDNLGMFGQAETSFSNAQNNATPTINLELQRIILETRFFKQKPKCGC
jgi:hypothetical protein